MRYAGRMSFSYRVCTLWLLGAFALGCEPEPYDCEPVETETWMEGCVVDVPYGLHQGSVCGDVAADDDSCPAVGTPEVDQLEDELAAEDEATSDPDQPEFHGIQCGPVTPQKNSGGECCYYALTGVLDSRCMD
jgi:hypothetical protein